MKTSRFSDNFNDVIQSMKQCGDIPLLVFIMSTIVFFVSPLSAINSIAGTVSSGGFKDIGSVGEILRFVFCDETQAEVLFALLPALVVCGALTAFLAFAFLVNKKKSNVIMSLGLSRAQIFKNRAFSSLGLLFAAVFLPLSAMLIVNVVRLGSSAQTFEAYFAILLMLFTCEAVGFSVGMLSCMLMGNLIEGLLCGGVGLVFPVAAVQFIQYVLAAFLRGYPAKRISTFGSVIDGSIFMRDAFEWMHAITPVTFFRSSGSDLYSTLISTCMHMITEKGAKILETSNRFSLTQLEISPQLYIRTLAWLGVSALLIGFSYKLFRTRKAERTGAVGASKPINILLSTTVMLSASALALNLLFRDSVTANFAMIIIVSAVTGIICTALCLRNKAALKKALLPFAVQLVLVAVAPLMCIFGLKSYSEYVPEASQVESAMVRIPYTSYSPALSPSMYTSAFEGEVTEESVFAWNNNPSVFCLFSQEEISQLTDAHKVLVNSKEFKGTSFDIPIVYVLKNGTVKVRWFRNANEEAVAALLKLNDTPSVREAIAEKTRIKPSGSKIFDRYEEIHEKSGITSLLNTSIYEEYMRDHIEETIILGNVEIWGGTCTTLTDISDIVDEQTLEQIAEYMAQDIAAAPFEEMLSPNEPQIGCISVEIIRKSYYGSSLGQDRYAIFSYMTRTIEYLKQIGVYDYMTQKSEIASIKLCPIKSYMTFFQMNAISKKTPEMNVSPESNLTRYGELLLSANSANAGTGFANAVTVTDKQELEQLRGRMLSRCYLGEGSGQLALCTFEDESAGLFFVPDAK
ncbi:MAG: hypothetical protein GX051_06960 [Clostridiales bacterium]|nr:hypothetical protein [Clostridiales bacterium]